MRTILNRSSMLVLALALPMGAMAASLVGAGQRANVVAVLIWLLGIGWGFHAMLRHRLAAEDQLLRVTSDLDLARDAHAREQRSLRDQLQALHDEWERLEACVADGDQRQLQARMHSVQSAIALLQQRAVQ